MPTIQDSSAGLFLGISVFEDERIPEVPFAVDDAVDLAHLFALELGLLSPVRTVLLLAGEPRKPESGERLNRLIESGARRQSARQRDVYRYLGEFGRQAKKDGIFLLAAATHGVSDQGGDFLVATDSLRERLVRTGIAVDDLFDEVARARAERRLVLLDACRERLTQGTRGQMDSAMSQSFAAAIGRATGVAVLSGATLGGFAYDDPEARNGVFSAAVLDGLHGAASAGPDGWITVRTLADFVQNQVAEWVRSHRPDHAGKFLGIGRRIEATAEALPLAFHPKVAEDLRSFQTRRNMAIARVKENQGRVITGAIWDQIVAYLTEDRPKADAERLLEEIEALDGTERSQRSLRDFLHELMGGPVWPRPPIEAKPTAIDHGGSPEAPPVQPQSGPSAAASPVREPKTPSVPVSPTRPTPAPPLLTKQLPSHVLAVFPGKTLSWKQTLVIFSLIFGPGLVVGFFDRSDPSDKAEVATQQSPKSTLQDNRVLLEGQVVDAQGQPLVATPTYPAATLGAAEKGIEHVEVKDAKSSAMTVVSEDGKFKIKLTPRVIADLEVGRSSEKKSHVLCTIGVFCKILYCKVDDYRLNSMAGCNQPAPTVLK